MVIALFIMLGAAYLYAIGKSKSEIIAAPAGVIIRAADGDSFSIGTQKYACAE